MIPTLHTDRLTLRAPNWDDFEGYAAFRASPRMATVGGPFDRGEAFRQLSALIGHWALRGYGRWMVADRLTDETYGIVGLYYPKDWPEPELAWSVYYNAEGRGIAYEAALASRAYAYKTLGMTRLVSAVDPSNSRSVALAKRMRCKEGTSFEYATYGTMHLWEHPGPEALA